MSADNERTALELLRIWEGDQLDAARADQVVGLMAPDARYHVFAWHDPFVGRDAIREELLRQAPFFSESHYEFLTVASVGNTVFVQRRDCVTMFGTPAKFDVVGVFEFDADGKVTCWRDYLDSAEIGAKVGQGAPEGTLAEAAPRTRNR